MALRGASALARRHNDRVRATSIPVASNHALRHAVEIRSETLRTEDLIALLRRHRIALVVADTAGKWPLLEDVTADFVYVRLHGDEILYTSGYTDKALRRWARKIRAWRRSRDVYCYFDNDAKVMAPRDAQALARLLAQR